MLAASEPRYVMFRDGLAVPLAPVLLVLDLEARGFSIARLGGDLLVRPASQLLPADCAALARWKAHVLALVDRCQEVQ